MGMRSSVIPASLLLSLVGSPVRAQHLHKLPVTPQTVAWGYYWSEAKPVLRIASGDIIDVDTMLTSTPDRLEKAGVRADDVQSSLRAIVGNVTDRGPGGHILTGPVFVEGAEPGDALQVDVVSIDLALPYGYNGCSGFIRENCEPGRAIAIIPLDRQRMIGTFRPGIEIPLKPFFGSMGVAPPPASGCCRRVSSRPASHGRTAGQGRAPGGPRSSTLPRPSAVRSSFRRAGSRRSSGACSTSSLRPTSTRRSAVSARGTDTRSPTPPMCGPSPTCDVASKRFARGCARSGFP